LIYLIGQFEKKLKFFQDMSLSVNFRFSFSNFKKTCVSQNNTCFFEIAERKPEVY